EVGDETSPRRPSELDQHEHRKRSEGRKDRRLRLFDHLVRERKDRRHHNRGARGALQRGGVHGWRSYVRPWHLNWPFLLADIGFGNSRRRSGRASPLASGDLAWVRSLTFDRQ